MYFSSILAVALASLAAAAPTSKYYGIGLEITTTPLTQHPAVTEPAPVQINKLTSLHGVHASKISFDKTASNVDINSIECRAYKDAAGVVPGSAPFTAKKPALLSTNLVEVGSVLCYIV